MSQMPVTLLCTVMVMVSVIAFRLVRKEPIYGRVTDTTEKRRSCRSPPENRRRPQATTGETEGDHNRPQESQVLSVMLNYTSN